jgi:hypothetical protein
MSAREAFTHNMLADETGASGDENSHARVPMRSLLRAG